MPFDALTNADNFRIFGNLTVQADPNGNAGTTSLDGGLITTDGKGNLTPGTLSSGAITGSAQVVANGNTINTANIGVARTAPGGAVTGVILQAGTRAGQIVTVINESAAASTITMAAAGTSNVAGGTTVSLAGLAAHVFVWDTGTSLWYQAGPATN